MARVFANATDSARARRYPPLATLSTGYDAPAIAALAARAGCREALTFAELMPGVAWPDDGSAIGERLGLRVLRRARDAWRLRSDLPEAEAWAWPPGQLVSQASVESDLAGRLLLTGRFGGRLLEPPDLGAGPHRPVGLPVLTAPSQVELRLRVGFLNLAPYFVSWNHLDAIQRLSSLPEMTPYRVGGTYDRPIPRRIVEEAGVPREAFGQVKRVGAALNVFHAHDLTPGSRRDFDAFLAAAPAPLRTSAGEKLRALWGQARVRAGAKPPSWRQSHEGRLYHWGFARTRPRYEV
jgi:hypothetical protein